MKTYLLTNALSPEGIYPDEVLDFWGEFYLANPVIRRRGVMFEEFLIDPLGVFHAIVFAPAAEEDPRLRARARAVQRALDLEVAGKQLPLPLEQVIVALEAAGARVSNGAIVEKLRHHAWPRKVDRQQPLSTEERA